MNPLLVACGLHGKRVAAVVCQHLLESGGPPKGVVENSVDPNDLQAWCYACEEKFQEEAGITEAFMQFNRFAVVCIVCFADVKLRNDVLTRP